MIALQSEEGHGEEFRKFEPVITHPIIAAFRELQRPRHKLEIAGLR